MAERFSQFLVAAPSSGSGKTTLTLGLLRALANRGLQVQPFKCGPDYIDTQHHSTAAGRPNGVPPNGLPPSINLDLFMASPEHVRASYGRYVQETDVAITEGVMGLFDGSDRMQGSSAAVAELLDIPVVLVVNAKAMAYSVAPLLYGFKNFYAGIRLVGAIFNNVGSESHYRFLADACADVGVEPLGYLPNNPRFAIPSRHLGLHLSSETDYEQIIQAIADELPKTVDLDRLLTVTQTAAPVVAPATTSVSERQTRRISVARDEAFLFTYKQNLDRLAEFGTVTFFSPLHDSVLPDTDFLYLPGGYPELHAQQLSANESMRTSIHDYCLSGGLAYAECGGLMYLSQSIQVQSRLTRSGTAWPMAGVLDVTTSMQAAKLTLGYRTVNWNDMRINGHEFHYSNLAEPTPLPSVASISNAKGIPVETKLYRVQNTFASYVHLYWGDNPAFIEHLLRLNSVETANQVAS
ncbi:cobyrinate a,c-diamide synthase [Spirosoma rhododendri]|uniref:Cobyrinate a,c-diamide synthase n=1 Tax=Spirosoma rhododendri TaxID=2728024 RepID=A0A7L5DUL6_9BACT|nr:cobyrinate a,c-diamide synthase [Spirosoma rhododendri]QJD79657.1 cobyrinate a,c-diamide synthase [Spirosoma rhododendri]